MRSPALSLEMPEMRIRHTLIALCLIGSAATAAPGDTAGASAASAASSAAAERQRKIDVLSHRLAREFGGDFEPHASDHFLLLHDTASERASARAELLEQTHAQFYNVFTSAGFQLQPLREPLLCVLFARQDAFAHYARLVDRIDMSWSGGYYSSRTNRVALYESEDEWRGHMHQSYADSGGPSDVDGTVAPIPSSRISFASTTHEAAHQIAFNSGLQKRGVMYPFWASEGLATSFESSHLEQALGPHRDNPVRRFELTDAHRSGRLMPLEEFIVLVGPPSNDAATIGTVYAQAWGLFHFLFQHEREALMHYMAALAKLEPGYRDAQTLREEFITSFGSVADIEQRWHEHLNEQ